MTDKITRGRSAYVIHYSDADTGGGKTFAISMRAITMARAGKKILIAQPSKFLVQQTAAQIYALCEDEPVQVTVITGDTHEHVVQSISEHFRAPKRGGEIVLITHAAYERVPFFYQKEKWHLVYDEVPQAWWYRELNIPNTHSLISEALHVEVTQELPEYGRVSARDAAYLTAVMRNPDGDEVYGLFSDIAAKVLSPHWRVYADAEQWDNMISGVEVGERSKRRKLTLHAVLEPSLLTGWETVTLLSADLQHSAAYLMWADRLRWAKDQKLEESMLYTKHQNGHLLTIIDLGLPAWSKNQRNKTAEDGRRILDVAVEQILRDLGDEPFAWLANTDIEDDLFGERAQAVRLPNASHGHNNYQHIHNAVLLSALLPPPAHFAFLDATGIDGDAVRTAIMHTSYYQAASRISLRNRDNLTPKKVYCADSGAAAWLADRFPGSERQTIDGMPFVRVGKPSGRPRLHESDAARQAKERDEARAGWEAALARLNPELRGQFSARIPGHRHVMSHAEFIAQKAAQRPDSQRPFNANMDRVKRSLGEGDEGAAARRVYMSVYEDLYSTAAWGEIACGSFREFVDYMRVVWRENPLAKADNMPFSPCATDGEGRAVADVESSSVIVMDNDGGDLSRHEFARLFPDLEMLIVNSASSTPERERWRVFLPLDYAADADIYERLVSRILDALKRWGYRSANQIAEAKARGKAVKHDCHGFDEAKLHAASIFNLPSIATAGESASFFEHLHEGRRPLDVRKWIASAIRPKRARRDSGQDWITQSEADEFEALEMESERPKPASLPIAFADQAEVAERKRRSAIIRQAVARAASAHRPVADDGQGTP